jgi:hypothetical protein
MNRRMLGTFLTRGSSCRVRQIAGSKGDGKAVYKLTVRTSRSTVSGRSPFYNSKGYLEPNPENAYSGNTLTAKETSDGLVTIQFGGCDGKIQNWLARR